MTVSCNKEHAKKSPHHPSSTLQLEAIYPQCRKLLDDQTWKRLIAPSDLQADLQENPEIFTQIIAGYDDDLDLPFFLADLAQLEWAYHRLKTGEAKIPRRVKDYTVNPTLQLLELPSKNLAALVNPDDNASEETPEPGGEIIALWMHPKSGARSVQRASDEDLLVMKMIIENITAEAVAAAADVPIGAVDLAVDRAVEKGIVLKPDSRIQRDLSIALLDPTKEDKQYSVVETFTLQWHVTQACDLQCKHCYDRSDRSPLQLEQALTILDDFRTFCQSRYVYGQVTFSGGNPLLYPHFIDLYRAAVERGMRVGILGNPAPRRQLEKIIAIEHPSFFQVSLEGLQKHNDRIRGSGHFDRTMEFLRILRDLDIYSMVMLTLTKDNINQVLPLAEELRDIAGHFTFNRLSMVGEGANLQLPHKNEYSAFLEDYMDAAKTNPILSLKDNLFNIVCRERGEAFTGGCTGFGCGAAFNFLTLLPDGEVHACRKFPSLMGNAFEQSLSDIYDSEIARQYRGGTKACASCAIRPSCGSCLAILYSHGLDIFRELDPFCFIKDIKGASSGK